MTVLGVGSAQFNPPPNFGLVEEDFYRSGMPSAQCMPFMERLSIKTILFLSHEDVPRTLLNFCTEKGVEIIRPVVTETKFMKASPPISEDETLFALQVVLDASKYPLHMICDLGRHRNGTVVGCLRKLQQWNLTSILEEYRRYAGDEISSLTEQFIELFDTSLVHIPSCKPSWIHNSANSM